MSIEIYSVALTCMESNCYLLLDSVSKKALIVDPGDYCAKLENMLKEHGVEKLEYILLTHGHFDHIMGAQKLQENYGGKIVIGKEDEICFTDKMYSLIENVSQDAVLPKKADITVNDGDVLDFAGRKIEIIHTPGHTKGGICYKIDKMLFTGDTLFDCSIGRTDFPGGDYKELISSVGKLTALEGNYAIYPGHGIETSLESQRWNNPYIRLLI
ncbi:MAG: MBL fold metallo-hydrolase [Acutalibacteraceae bacterium]